MKKNKFISAFIVLACLLCVSGCEKKAEETDKTTDDVTANDTTDTSDTTDAGEESTGTDTRSEPIVTYDETWYFADMTTRIMADDKDWVLTGWNTRLYFDGCVGADENGGGFNLINKHEVNDEKTYSLEFELYTPENGDEEYNKPQNTLFVGLRVYFETSSAEENDGIWLGIKENTLAVKYSGLDDVKEYTLPYSFVDGFRRTCIEDRQSENTVIVSVYNDEGEKEELYRLSFGDGKIKIYSYSDGFAEVYDTLETDNETYYGGYCRLWSNNRGNVFIKNVARTK